MTEIPTEPDRRTFIRALNERNPPFRLAVKEDARVTALHRGERSDFKPGLDTICQIVRLIWVCDAFTAHVAYRLKTAMVRHRVPLLPRVLHRFSMRNAQVAIGPGVFMHPGVYIVHGQVVLDGLVEVRPGTVISPWVTIGLTQGDMQGPIIGDDVHIGTGAKIIGPVTVGSGSIIGANAVVIDDVPPKATVVGMPARVVRTAD